MLLPLGFGFAQSASQWKRVASLVVVAGVVPFLMMPGWERLADVRVLYLSGFGLVCLGGIAAIDFAAARLRPAWLVGVMCLTLGMLSGMLMYFLSLTFGQLLLAAAGATLGVGLLRLKSADEETARGIGPVLVVVLLAGCFLGFIDPAPPLYGFLVPGLVPFVLAACAMMGKKSGKFLAIVQVVGVLGLFGIAGGWTHFATALPDEIEPAVVEPEISDDEFFDQLFGGDSLPDQAEGQAPQ